MNQIKSAHSFKDFDTGLISFKQHVLLIVNNHLSVHPENQSGENLARLAILFFKVTIRRSVSRQRQEKYSRKSYNETSQLDEEYELTSK